MRCVRGKGCHKANSEPPCCRCPPSVCIMSLCSLRSSCSPLSEIKKKQKRVFSYVKMRARTLSTFSVRAHSAGGGVGAGGASSYRGQLPPARHQTFGFMVLGSFWPPFLSNQLLALSCVAEHGAVNSCFRNKCQACERNFFTCCSKWHSTIKRLQRYSSKENQTDRQQTPNWQK